MTIIQKFAVSFGLALILHVTILALFGISFDAEKELVKHKPLPEIIQASILDDETIQQEADRLKANEENKRLRQKQHQKNVKNKQLKEQQRLDDLRDKRIVQEQKAKELNKKIIAEETKAKELAKKRQNDAKLEKQKQQKLHKLRVAEAARQAKIKKQKIAEQKRLDELKKAKEQKLQQQQLAEKKRQQDLKAKEKADAAEKEAIRQKQVAAEKARVESARQATISTTAAIQQKVNQRWIKPISSSKGLKCTVRVKLLPSGDVMDATVMQSSGDSIFDRSAENAVLKASPLPVPKDRALFSKHFRTFVFEFKPE